jgi:transcriptional regulator with XRE-family HTH domain
MAGSTKLSAAQSDTIGARLRRPRRRAGLSQLQLAAAAECSDSLISKVERGVHNLDSLQVARRIAHVRGVPLGELLGLDASASTSPPAKTIGSRRTAWARRRMG